MPKSFNQKLKILYLMDVLLERTDEEHPISAKDMAQYLRGYGISVERKTVYDDIEALRIYGLDIRNRREQLFIEPGNKTVNEEIYSNIQTIYDGMSRNRQIRFHYYEWTLSKELKPKKNGEWYQASPWKMIWKNENYYLLGLDERSGVVKHYRVDKMMQVEVIEKQKRNGGNIFRDFDLGKFSSSTFGMFGGKERSVRMEFENQFVGVVLDRFGQDVMLIPKDENHFSMQAQIKVSTQFFGWLAGLGTGAVIVSPENIRREYVSFLKKTLKNYGEKYDGKI